MVKKGKQESARQKQFKRKIYSRGFTVSTYYTRKELALAVKIYAKAREISISAAHDELISIALNYLRTNKNIDVSSLAIKASQDETSYLEILKKGT